MTRIITAIRKILTAFGAEDGAAGGMAGPRVPGSADEATRLHIMSHLR